MTKRLFTALVVFVMVVACIFALSSCKKEHSHHYTASNVAATCTEDGYTLYNCSCGASYTETTSSALGHALTNHVAKAATCSKDGYGAYVGCTRCGYSDKVVVPALGHCYAIAEITYPTPTEGGSKHLVCEMCGDSKVEAISAASFIFPKASDILASLIGGAEVAVKADPDTMVIVSEELDNYATESGEKVFYALKVAEAALSSEDGVPAGFVKFELGTASFVLDGTADPDSITATEFENLLSVYLYVNGEVLSVEAVANGEKNEMEQNLSELFYTAIGQNLGLTYEDVLKASYTISEFVEIAPSIEGLVEALNNVKLPEVSDEYAQTMTKILESVSEKFSVVSTDENGNTVVTTDLTALGALIDNINGKTVSQYIDEVYGAGSADNLKKFIIDLPDMMLKEIADSAITFANNYGVNVNDIYSFVDLFVYVASNGETKVSIKYEIEKNYHLTLVDLMFNGMEESEKAESIANFKEGLAEAVDMFAGYTFNQLFNGFAYGDPDYIPEGETEPFQFLDELKAVLGELNEMVYLTVVTDAEGMFVSMNCAFGSFNAMIERVIETDDAHIVISTEYQGLDLTLDVTVGSTGLSFTFNKGTDEMASGFFKIDVKDEYVEDEYGNVYYNEISREVTAAIFANDKQYLKFATYSEYGNTKFFHLEVKYDKEEYVTYPDPENQEYVSETVVTFTDLILIDIVSGDTKDTVYVQIGDFIADIEYVYGADRDTLTFDIGEIDGTIYYSEEIDGEDTISTTEGIIYYYEFILVDFEIERVNDVVRNAAALVNVIVTENVYEETIGGVIEVRTERYISESLIITYTANDEGFTLVIVYANNTSAEIRITYDDVNGFVIAVNANVDGAMENMLRLSLKGEGDDLHIRLDTEKFANVSSSNEGVVRTQYVEIHGGLTITVVLPEAEQ